MFHAVAGLSPEDRAAYLGRACAGDAQLQAEVEALVRADASQGAVIERAVGRSAASFVEAQSPLEGTRIGPYRLIREIGRGGMGVVYHAERADDAFRLEVAIKVVPSGLGTADAVRRFRSERQILADFDHPNIARLLDGGTTDRGEPFLVMELARGEPIDAYCDRRAFTVRQRIDLFRAVCDAVDYAHMNGVIHRDIKPSNVLVGPSGVPKLLDFGIAKLLDPSRMPHTVAKTRTGMLLLTPDYASPEQARGGPITAATDIHGLGALLYRLLTGRPPHQLDRVPPAEMVGFLSQPPKPASEAVLEEIHVRHQRREEEVVTPERVAAERGTTPRDLAAMLAGDLDRIVAKALRARPEERFATAAELSDALRRWLDGRPAGVVAGAPAGAAPWYRRPAYVGAAIAAVIALILLIVALSG